MRILGNIDGFSLVEVMVGVGLLGGLAYWGLKTQDMQTKFSKTVEVKNENEAIFKDIRHILSHAESCSFTFQNWIADPATPPPLAPTTIYFRDESAAGPQPRYTMNPNPAVAPKYGGGTIQIIGLRMSADAFANIPAGETKGNTNLIIKFRYANQNNYSSDEIERKIPLRVEINNVAERKIIYCSSAGLTSELDNIYLKILGGQMRGDIIMEDGFGIIFQSDRRLKLDIRKMGPVLPKINALRPVTYRWKANGSKDHGVIAQDVRSIFPEMVNTDDEGNLSVDYVQFSPLMLKGLQEVDGESRTLKTRINKMENEQKEMFKLMEGLK